MSKQELRSTVPGGDKLFKAVLDGLAAQGEVVVDGDLVRSGSHRVTLGNEEKDLRDRLLKLVEDGGNAPPVLKEILAETGADPKRVRSLLALLEKEGKVVRVKDDIYFSGAFLEATKKRLSAFIGSHGGITPSQFHEVTGSSRKFNIPLLEYLDRTRFTMRVGDQRVLRGSGTSGEGGKVE